MCSTITPASRQYSRRLATRNKAAMTEPVQAFGQIVLATRELRKFVDAWLEAHDVEGEYTPGLQLIDVAFGSIEGETESVCQSIVEDLRGLQWNLRAASILETNIPGGSPGTLRNL